MVHAAAMRREKCVEWVYVASHQRNAGRMSALLIKTRCRSGLACLSPRPRISLGFRDVVQLEITHACGHHLRARCLRLVLHLAQAPASKALGAVDRCIMDIARATVDVRLQLSTDRICGSILEMGHHNSRCNSPRGIDGGADGLGSNRSIRIAKARRTDRSPNKKPGDLSAAGLLSTQSSKPTSAKRSSESRPADRA